MATFSFVLAYTFILCVNAINTRDFGHFYQSNQNNVLNISHDVKGQIDPDVHKNITEFIIGEGYPFEKYTVETSDGFLLDLHRIPWGRQNGSTRNVKVSRPAVYLQHALLSSAADWVMNFAHGSLGFILADAGFDVWMGNTRGNTYSRQHVRLQPDDPKFWEWSFDEMAQYDTPAFIDFVLEQTKQDSLFYIGHSQGTTMAFALLAQRPDFAQKIKLFVALAPVAHLNHMKSPIKYLADFPDKLLYDVFGQRDFLPNGKFLKFLVDKVCADVLTRWICYNDLFLFSGYDISNLNQTRLPVYMNQSPSGVSTRDMVHFAQTYREKQFVKYNYGSAQENYRHYNQSQPPQYDVTKINVPIVAFTSTKDWLSDPEDASKLFQELPNLKAKYEISGWNHIDFAWGMDAPQRCYSIIVDWLHNLTSRL
ncbi:lysosomal acid lipase/cholesteryl ester hydrolase-like [Physella acuta]|uniref:lysosomal acid lipase/cholesteryl ester hydrolase-like n=1 Tax=Physella acuta TaxID=109671 RepID=UPI0027DABDA9|nr:lysosomal acid lipase/cholesteryl ester hydrolase-like [Physella acuta]XP_059165813.1 lysosomal acid lipase/cholesteryl ester hydrolase-like [Physella acuta]XP_059165814.1 lysosomal acid lipase/cholesteryl ester hydrolase-like [Physella acuta]